MEESKSPFNFWCPGVVDLILQHFTVPQLFALSEVSQDYYFLVANYKKFLRNVIIKVNAIQNISDDGLIKLLSRRKYENLEIDGSEMVSKMQFLLTAKWRTAKVSNMIFNRSEFLQKFFVSSRNTLEELTMNSVFVFNCDKKIVLSLPKLKRLEMIECNDQEDTFVKRVTFVISDCNRLEYMNLEYAGVSEENQKKLLLDNKSLTDLSIAILKDSFFDPFLSGGGLKLERLAIKFSTQDRRRQRPNFYEFLQSQSRFLSTVEINGWINVEVLVIVFKMPKIKFLQMSRVADCFIQLDWTEIEQRLKLNPTMQELILTDDITPFQSCWQTLLRNVPNLSRFQMFNSSYFP